MRRRLGKAMALCFLGLLLALPGVAGAEEAVKPDPNAFLLSDMNPDTTTVSAYVADGDIITWEFVDDPVVHGPHSLKVDIDTLGWSSIWLIAPEGEWDLSVHRAVRFWVYGDGSGMNIRVAARDKNNTRFESSETYTVDFTGWKRIEVPLSSFPAGMVYPLHTFVFAQMSKSCLGTLYFDLVEAVK